MSIKVLGHIVPDTDSTVSPIVYAWYLRNYRNLDATAYVAGELNKEADFVLDYFGVEKPEKVTKVEEDDKLVLVDTNNPDELVDNWDKAELIQIIDHHKLFGLHTSTPIDTTIKPYGSTPTVMWNLIDDAKEELPREMAGLLSTAIISDTLKFTSATTTTEDHELALALAEKAGVDIDQLANDMFAAKSNLDGMNLNDILLSDHKNYEWDDDTYKVGVLETTDPSQALAKAEDMRAEMRNIIEEQDLEGFFFFVVDILNTEATLLTAQDEDTEVAKQAFEQDFDEQGFMKLEGVVSRKKQIVPKLETVLGDDD